jgi:hypothetical protein
MGRRTAPERKISLQRQNTGGKIEKLQTLAGLKGAFKEVEKSTSKKKPLKKKHVVDIVDTMCQMQRF